MLRMVCIAALAVDISTPVHAQSVSMPLPATDIRDIRRMDPGRINLRPSRDLIVPVSISLGAKGARIGNSVAVDSLHLDIGALVATGTDRGKTGTASEKYFSLTIEGKEYVLDVLQTVFDSVFGMQHVLAAVVNTTPDAYARFTFDPESRAIAGTVVSDDQTFRIVSSNDREAQLVFRLGSGQTDAKRLITSEKLVASSIAQVERRNAQTERIAEIKPDSFTYPKNGWTTSLNGGAIGKVDLATPGNSEAIAHVLKELSVFTRATDDEEFEIVSSGAEADGGRHVRFRQLIGGIPVDFVSIMDVGPEGNIKYLQTRVFDPSGIPTELISRQEALRIATEVIEREKGHLGIVKIDWRSNVAMEYVARTTSQEEYAVALTPTWHVPAHVTTSNGTARDAGVLVFIDAATGKADIQRNTIID